MLSDLYINNLGIIDELSLKFDEGFNAITGVSGAGKSLIVRAIQLIAGARGRAEDVGNFSDKVRIQGLFVVDDALLINNNSELKELFDDEDLSDGITVVREYSKSGRSKAFVNGILIPLSTLRELMRPLLSISHQGMKYDLLSPAYQLQLLDSATRSSKALCEYRRLFEQCTKLRRKITQLAKERELRELNKARFERIVRDLSPLNLRIGLRDQLVQTLNTIKNKVKLADNINKWLAMLEEDGGIIDRLNHIVRELEKEPELYSQELLELCSSAQKNLEEFERAISGLLGSQDRDENDIDTLMSKISVLNRYMREYQTDEQGLIELLARSRDELEKMKDSINLEALKCKLGAAEHTLRELGQVVSTNRKAMAKSLKKYALQSLNKLGIKDGNLHFSFIPTEPTRNGIEEMQILISFNKGQPLKPIEKIVSGGEISRLMLALLRASEEIGRKEEKPVTLKDKTYIFDEIDTGVSGSIAHCMGEEIKAISKRWQVICITHLPQIAALADTHISIRKETKATKTVVSAAYLRGEDRKIEIARMLSGKRITDASTLAAGDLLINE